MSFKSFIPFWRAGSATLLLLGFTLQVAAHLDHSTDNLPPVVLVPGAPATELYDPHDGKLLWPSAKVMLAKYGSDHFALPLDQPETYAARPGDVIRKIRVLGMAFNADVYRPLEDQLTALGYRRGDWDQPRGGAEYFIYTYDWRLSVERNGRGLHAALQALQSRRPDRQEKFVMLGHSLGGLVIRYALMFGGQPLGVAAEGEPAPPLPPVTWAGAAQMQAIYLAATPNGGSFESLRYLHHGTYWRMGWGAFSASTLFTFPAVFDLIPPQPEPLLDPQGRTLDWDLNNPEHWFALRWSVFHPGRLRGYTLEAARRHLRRELIRKNRLHAALALFDENESPVTLRQFGGDCQQVLRTAVVAGSLARPRIRFDAPRKSALAALLYEPGDTMISRRSMRLETAPTALLTDIRTETRKEQDLFSCVTHHRITSSPDFIGALLPALQKTALLDAPPTLLPDEAGGSAVQVRENSDIKVR